MTSREARTPIKIETDGTYSWPAKGFLSLKYKDPKKLYGAQQRLQKRAGIARRFVVKAKKGEKAQYILQTIKHTEKDAIGKAIRSRYDKRAMENNQTLQPQRKMG